MRQFQKQNFGNSTLWFKSFILGAPKRKMTPRQPRGRMLYIHALPVMFAGRWMQEPRIPAVRDGKGGYMPRPWMWDKDNHRRVYG